MKSAQSDRAMTLATLVALVIAEWSFVASLVSAIYGSNAVGVNSFWQLPSLLSLPRLLVGLCAGLVLAVVDSRAMRLAVLGAYGVLLLWSFDRHEIYVRWSDADAVAVGVVPYATGLIGMGLGFALRRPIRHRLNLS
jgi:hypothetical protein